MARAVYVSPTFDTERASELGLGLIVDPSLTAPYAYVEGAGEAVRLDEPTTRDAVHDALQPLLVAENATAQNHLAAMGRREQIAAKAQTALTANAAFLALTSPTNAQAVAQVQSLTRQMNALIRIVLNEVDTIEGT